MVSLKIGADHLNRALAPPGFILAFPEDWLFDLVRDLVDRLMTRCNLPDPSDAYVWLTRTDWKWWEKLLDLPGRRDRLIRRAVREHWTGPKGRLADVTAAVRAGIRARLTRSLLTSMYGDVRATAS